MVLRNDLNKSAYEYSKSHISQINDILQPLFRINFTTFSYTKIFSNNKYLLLCNRLDWLRHHHFFINNQDGFFEQENRLATIDKVNYSMWPNQPTDQILLDLYDFNIWNGISFTRRKKDYVERICLATNIDNEYIKNLYLNNIVQIKRFISYFRDRSSNLLYNYDYRNLASFKNKIDISSINIADNINLDSYHNKILQKYIRCDDGSYILLSKRETECLNYLADGKSVKQIAQLTFLSPKTIDHYIENIKAKTGLRKRSDLIINFENYS